MRRLVIGTAGHIDHGKSALVRALTGIEPDRLKEEQERGITIDLGFAHAEVEGVGLAFVDVPGHERFIRNMLAGATGIDAVLLVIAADESVMPQTREHLDICRLLDVRAGVIALTKADLADPDMRAIARVETRELVAGTFLEHAPVVDVSSTTGEGLDALRREMVALTRQIVTRPSDGSVRLPIDRVFTLRGFGTVVTGTLVSGTIRGDDPLILLPGGRTPRVRGLHVHGHAVREAGAGQRVAVNLGDVQVHEIARGETLASPGALEPTRRVDVRIDVLRGASPLRHGARVRVHQGTSEVMARVAIARLLGDAEAIAGAPATIPPGARAHARLRLEAPLVITRGDRFVLRTYSPMATVAGGVVLDPLPRRAGLRTAASRARFDELDPGEDEAPREAPSLRAMRAIVQDEGRAGIALPRLVARLGVAPAAVARLLGGSAGTLVRLGDLIIAREAYASASKALVALVTAHHAASVDSEGIPREEARDRLRLDPRVLDTIVEELTQAGTLVGRERLALPGRSALVSDADRAAVAAVERTLLEQGLKPPETTELATRAGLAPAAVERALAQLVRQKRVVKIGGLAFHRQALDRLIADVRALKTAGGEARVDVATFKSRYDLTRKFAIPLLEFLDRERVTRRVGDARLVL